MEKGRVYLIGCGLNKGHLTEEAKVAIKESDVLLYDRLIDAEILKIIRAKKIYIGKKPGRSDRQDIINKKMLSLAKKGKIVARLKAGDPLLFSRGYEEYLYLNENNVNVRIIPGLSAFSILSELGIPLTYRGYSSSVAIITGTKSNKDISKCYDADTLVYYMFVQNLEKIIKYLIKKKNPNTRCMIVESAFRKNYRVISGRLKNITQFAKEAEIESPAILIVGNVLKLRRLNLKNKKVLSFRQDDLGNETKKALKSLGSKSINHPIYDVSYRKFKIPIADIYAFTSVNAVRSVFSQYNLNGKFVAIGSRTKEELERICKKASIPKIETTAGLESHLREKFSKKKIVVFCSPKSRVTGFKKVVIYDIRLREKDNTLKKLIRDSDILFLTSPEIARYIAKIIPIKILNKKSILVIGPKTALAAKELKLHVDYMLERPQLIENAL